jgi:hypothetical protein
MIQDSKARDIKSFQAAPAAMDMQSVMMMVYSMKEQMDGMERLFKNRLDEVSGMKSKMDTFETFVRRRFDEVSMEINATSQQLEYAEEGLAGRFCEVLSTISAISFSGNGLTAANTGVELQAVLADTETAANAIMDAADRISNRMMEPQQLESNEGREQFLVQTQQDLQDILMACSFQDLTGQRVRKTLESLQQIEEQISSTMIELGIEVKADPLAGGVRDSTENHAHSQADIDALFS